MKRNDIILLLILLFLGGIGLLITGFFRNQDGSYVRITAAGERYGEYSLKENREIFVQNGEWTNTVVIENGAVFVREANCPDRYCVLHAKITGLADPIVCLPHKLVVEIVRKSDRNRMNTKESIDGIAE